MSTDNSATTSSTSAPEAATGGAGAVAAAGGGETNRSIVVDAAFFEEQFLRCQVCQERFHETERPPKSLPCNHTFCVPCLTQIFSHAQPQSRRNLLRADDSMDGPLKCPTCRVEIFVSKSKIKDLPNDHRVVQMMDFLSQAVSKTQNVCTKHERQPLNFFCKKCLHPVCRDCTVLDHKEQQGHVIVDVKQALNDRSGEFNQVEEQCRRTLERMKNRSDALANASKRLDIQERQLRNEIKETFIEYRLLLEKRQEALTMALQQRVRDQKALINTRFVHVCEHGTQLQKLYDAFTKAKGSSDIEQLFNLHKEMKDREEQFNSVASAEDTELFKSSTFESTSEGEFLSGISSLGEVAERDDLTLKDPVSAHQLLYLDNEDRRERERLMQYEMTSGEQDLEEPEIDVMEVMEDMSNARHREDRERMEDLDVQRMLDVLRQRPMVEIGGHRVSREEMEEDVSPPPSRPRRRPRSNQYPSSSLMAQLGILSPMPPFMPESNEDSSSHSRSGSRSRRSTSSREGGSGGGGSGLRGYRVERHAHYPYPDDSN
ncbi:uncharacterized protein LOC143283720 isoform X2 [Babylonia areolata]